MPPLKDTAKLAQLAQLRAARLPAPTSASLKLKAPRAGSFNEPRAGSIGLSARSLAGSIHIFSALAAAQREPHVDLAVEGKTEKPRGCADCGSCADRSAGEIYSDCLRGLCLRLWAVDLFSLRAWGWRRRRCCWASENTIGLAAAGLLAPRGG